MSKPGPSLAKITRPKLSSVAARERLFRLLDKGKSKPVTWIASPAGSGKTTLIASWLDSRRVPCIWYQVDQGDGDLASFFYYLGVAAKQAAPRRKKSLPLLTPEYLPSILVFTRRYFEELFRRLKPPAVVVLDNYQDAPPDSGFHEMIGQALEMIPEGMRIVIISRSDPPPQLARHAANSRIHSLGWDDVRFTLGESESLLKTQSRGRVDRKTAALLFEKTEGWAAGLVLLLAGAGYSAQTVHSIGVSAPDKVFDYFASELFGKEERTTQDILLKTSFLYRIEPTDAEQLTGNATASQILERLSRNHYFTQKYDRAFQYHPLFREFLQNRAITVMSPDAVALVRQSAAALLETSGRSEEAVGLYLDAREWGDAERLLLVQAGVLVSQGRSTTLVEWLRRFPPEHVERSAWLLYWTGMCRMAFDPYESRRCLERAFELFSSGTDATGLLLSWASIVDTFVYAWGDFAPLDRWIAVMETILSRKTPFPSAAIEVRVAGSMLCALANRQPSRPDIVSWADRVQGIVIASNDVQLQMTLGSQLLFYYMWNGDFSKIALIVEALRPTGSIREYDALTKQQWYAWKAMYSWFVADWQACWDAISTGVKNAEHSGIHLLDLFMFAQGVFGGLSLGYPDEAASCLEKMALTNSPRPGDKALYHYQAASVAWFEGDLGKAAEHGKMAVSLCESIGWPISIALCVIELAVTLFDDGKYEEADAQLGKALDICGNMGGLAFHAYMHGAWFALERGKEQATIDFLRRGFTLGARYGFLNLPRWNNDRMAHLCAEGIKHNIEPEYVLKLIKIRKLTPPDQADVPDAWPYSVRILTLGRFQILKDEKPVVFSGKVQKKPLELLKTLIAFNGVDVPEDRIAEALWPEAEGDTAHRSFETTLYRLRKLVGDGTLKLADGLLSIDRGYCWVDAWAFEHYSDCSGKGDGCDEEDAAKAVELYRGLFLPSDVRQVWSLSLREKLRSRFTRLIMLLGARQEEQGKWETALNYYLKGLEIDELAEEFYQQAMVCHSRLGNSAQAASLYRRYRTVLHRVFGLPPSARIAEIYRSLGDTDV